ncbi:MAG: hypothetical protein K2L76_01470 [Muribaculaceae bacterium]|nr:hypothetical protein [Muribaculaceae bacterium]
MKKLLLTLMLLLSLGFAASAETWSYEVVKGAYTNHDFSNVKIGTKSDIKLGDKTWQMLVVAIDNNSQPGISNDGTAPAGILIGAAAKPAQSITLYSGENFADYTISKVSVTVNGGANSNCNYDATATVGSFTDTKMQAVTGNKKAVTLEWTPNTNGEIEISFTNNVTTVGKSKNSGLKICSIVVEYTEPETELVGFTHEESFGRTVVRVEYMLHLNNHKDANEYTVELTVGGMTFSNTEHSDASIVEEAANAPMRALNPDDVASETTLKGTILATGLEAEKEYGTASVAVKLGDKEIHNATIENFTTGTTGIEDVTVEGEAAAEYFNLQGVRVAEPRAGQIYIVRRGAKATKELVK